MATNFSPVLGVVCFKPFPSIVMFGMKGFHISASGAIQGLQGHHGPLVKFSLSYSLSVSYWTKYGKAASGSDLEYCVEY